MPADGRPFPRLRLSPTSLFTLAFFCAGVAVAYAGSTRIPTELGQYYFYDYWFEGDVPRAVGNLTDRRWLLPRASLHPLYSLTLAPAGLFLTKVIGLTAWDAATLISTAGAGLLTGLFFLVARRMSGRTLDASVATLALMASSAFLFWTAVPETFVWSAASILAVLFVIGLPRQRPPSLLFVAASAAALGVTITNWSIALVAAAVSCSRRRALVLSVAAFAIVAALGVVSTNVFPNSDRFMRLTGEAEYLNRGAGSWMRVPPAFFVSAIVAPVPTTIARGTISDKVEDQRSMQRPDWLAQRPLMLGAAALWLAAFGVGAGTLVRRLTTQRADRVTLTLAFAVGSQFILYVLYGPETFVYALNFAPLLMLVALTGATTRMRPVSLALLAAVALAGGVNNWSRFTEAAAEARAFTAGSERGRAQAAWLARPGELWPRSRGHVPLGLPGLPELAKAYVEPGGAFSPSVGSFGMSVWTRDTNGNVLHSSDSVLLKVTRSSFLDAAIGIVSTTPDYVVRWDSPQPGTWRMRLTPTGLAERLTIAVRSTGPAGGPIRSILNQAGRLTINERWQLTLGDGLSVERIGVESRGWIGRGVADAPQRAQDPRGWLYALLHVDGPAELVIVDPQAPPTPSAAILAAGPMALRSGIDLDLPEPRFAASLDAQVAQILQGLPGRNGWSGEAFGEPRTWERDAAVVFAALVRAGRADAARALIGDEPAASSADVSTLRTNAALRQARRQLALGDTVRVWAALQQFWSNSLHPGLFTLGESILDEREQPWWEGVRGWTLSNQVTPHYRASAEMILLQTAMLADVDRTQGREALIVGAGVKPEWLKAPIGARGLVTDWGRVDWSWDGRAMHVTLERDGPIRLGSAFPDNAPIVVQRSPPG